MMPIIRPSLPRSMGCWLGFLTGQIYMGTALFDIDTSHLLVEADQASLEEQPTRPPSLTPFEKTSNPGGFN